MGTIAQSFISCFSCTNHPENGKSRVKASEKLWPAVKNEDFSSGVLNRRAVLSSGLALVSSTAFGLSGGDGFAVVKQGLLAGRVPGLSEPDHQASGVLISLRLFVFLAFSTVFFASSILVFAVNFSFAGLEDFFGFSGAEILYEFLTLTSFSDLTNLFLRKYTQTGWRTYQRPEDKSGGHGVGWSPIIPYKFSVPQDWDEVPVSIADLGGTEIDLRFASPKEGRVFVIVAPVLRFSDDLGDDATIERIGTPEKVINAFGPEIIGENVEGKVLSSEIDEHEGRKYYQFELEPPHILITATAAGNRLYLFNVTGNGLQWKKHYKDLKRIADSFRVV